MQAQVADEKAKVREHLQAKVSILPQTFAKRFNILTSWIETDALARCCWKMPRLLLCRLPGGRGAA